jgi:hypothetical protein
MVDHASGCAVIFLQMSLADRIAQCCTPFIVRSSDRVTRLSGAADFAADIAQCPMRFVLSDDLTRLCTALAYSKGARTLACTDLLHVPAERVWIEWCDAVWLSELQHYGFRGGAAEARGSGRRGAWVRSSANGRRGSIRTFWSVGATDFDLLASSMQAHFDLDTELSEPRIRVSDTHSQDADVLGRCFRFQYERSWAEYYRRALLPAAREAAVMRHALGTIAPDIPMLMAFFLLLSTRTGLPRRAASFERLNRVRARVGKCPLLDYVEVLAPILPDPGSPSDGTATAGRRAPRLHHVRGHLVRRGSQLFWRLPHVRGNPRSGVIRSRTVTWTVGLDSDG